MVISSSNTLQEVLSIVPEWENVANHLLENDNGHSPEKSLSGSNNKLFDFLSKLGPQAIYKKLLILDKDREKMLTILRDYYFQPHLSKMLAQNQNLKRFFAQRMVAIDEQKTHTTSMSVEVAQKLVSVLSKHTANTEEDGFKVLIPAYMQRSVGNAIVDFIRQEWNWEKHTLQDVNLDPEQDDPREGVADEQKYIPEHQALSGEQVQLLNQLKTELAKMLKDESIAQEALIVVDCKFGLGLTKNSTIGQELTMRECCEVLNIAGETQARKIARCQVLLDKGLDMVRQRIREHLPSIVDVWQSDVNINTASRRELSQHLGLTDNEIERLLKARQLCSIDELLEKQIVKQARFEEIVKSGAVAAFVPLDINSATNRDIQDILGADKNLANAIVEKRPFSGASELIKLGLIDQSGLNQLIQRGLIVKANIGDQGRIDLNQATIEELCACGLSQQVAGLAIKGRPFYTFSELEDFLDTDFVTWTLIRQKFRLGIN